MIKCNCEEKNPRGLTDLGGFLTSSRISRAGFSQFLFDDLLKNLKRLCTHNRLPIDHKRWCGCDTHGAGVVCLGLHLGGERVVIQAIIKCLTVQLQFIRKCLEIFFAEGSLVLTAVSFEEEIMVNPKSVLLGCAFAGFRSPEGFLT